MAHEITIRQDGFAEIAWVGETPWHRLGQQLQPDATLEQWREQAGLNWEIQRAPVQFTDSSNIIHDYPGQEVLLRSDNGKPLSIVSNRYQEVQPETVLEFFRDLVEVAGCRINTAGSLNGGRRIWALAETGRLAEVVKNDAVTGYILLATSCDKGLATTARFTSVRVVCANTLAMAERQSEGLVSVPHSVKFNPDAAKRAMGIQLERFDTFVDAAQVLSKKPLNDRGFKTFMETLLQPTAPAWQRNDPEFQASELRSFKRILELFQGDAIGAEHAPGTYWSAVNAVTEYIDHHRPARSDDARMNNAWFGHGDKLKTRALELALAA